MTTDWLDAIKWNDQGLVPAIAQETGTGKILMMAWMNREALAATQASGHAVYWSRSRGKLWHKGESSGHEQLVKALRLDCDADVILLYFAFNLTASVLSIPLGRLSDRIGRKSLLVAGYLVFSAVYLGFAFGGSRASIAVIFVLYGVYSAMISGVERAFIAEISPAGLKGTMLGLHSTVVGIALLPASMIAGILWSWLGAPAPFLFGSVMSLAAAIALQIFMRNARQQHLS